MVVASCLFTATGDLTINSVEIKPHRLFVIFDASGITYGFVRESSACWQVWYPVQYFSTTRVVVFQFTFSRWESVFAEDKWPPSLLSGASLTWTFPWMRLIVLTLQSAERSSHLNSCRLKFLFVRKRLKRWLSVETSNSLPSKYQRYHFRK